MQSAAAIVERDRMEPGFVMRALPADGFDPLVPPNSWEAIASLCDGIPAQVHTLCFECRLSAEDDRVDFAFALLPGPDAVQLGTRLRAAHPTSEPWAAFCDFLADWSVPGSDLAYRIPFVCAAFDLAAFDAWPPSAPVLPAPCVSLCVDPDFFARRLGLVPPHSPLDRDLPRLVDGWVARLVGRRMPARAGERLAACLAADPTVQPKHLSLMLPRPGVPMKLDLTVDAERIGRLLAQVGWPADPAALHQAVAAWAPSAAHVQLNLVLHPELAPPLEVEIFTGAAEGTGGERLRFLERLVAAGLAAPSKAALLHDIWTRPSVVVDGERAVARSWYIKLRFEGTTPRDAKAYVGMMPRQVRRASQD
jgi:hypothetical protein